MSQKKKKAPGAQQLIDSLLDEKTPQNAGASRPPAFSPDKSAPPPQESHLLDDSDEAVDLNNVYFHEPDVILNTDNTPTEQKRDAVKLGDGPMLIELDADDDDASFRLESGTANNLKLKPLDVKNAPKPAQKQPKPEVRGEQRPDIKAEQKPLPKVPVLANDKTRVGAPQPPVAEAAQPKAKPIVKPETVSHSEFGEVDEPTVKLKMQSAKKVETPVEEDLSVNRWMPTEIKSSPVLSGSDSSKTSEPRQENKVINSAFSSAEAALKQSESLRVAQGRITDLESEIERLRRENEKLSTAGETLRRRSDELLSKTESLEIQTRESERIHDEEKKVLRGQLQAKERESSELRAKLEEMESRLESNFKKIRVRERELEHRLEIIKMESATLASTKDKMILELKRQIDQLAHETEYGKQKSQELFNQYKEKQETIRRVVRALRIALTILEGDEDAAPLKKVD